MLKIVLIFNAEYIVIFGNSGTELQHTLDLLFDYCYKWKLLVNTCTVKMTIIVFKGGVVDNQKI